MAESIDVTDNPARHRFEIVLDGELAGVAEYRDRPHHHRVFTHTKVDPAFEGRGLGGTLIRAALDDARERGLTVVPLCPFVVKFLRDHPDYADLLEASHRAEFDAGGS